MKNFGLLFFLWSMFLVACTQEEWGVYSEERNPGVTFKLYEAGYEGEQTRSVVVEDLRYDRVGYCIVDKEGDLVENIKSKYNPVNAQISVEGLHSGQYYCIVWLM